MLRIELWPRKPVIFTVKLSLGVCDTSVEVGARFQREMIAR